MENTSEFQSRRENIIPINSNSTLKHDIMKAKGLEEKGMSREQAQMEAFYESFQVK